MRLRVLLFALGWLLRLTARRRADCAAHVAARDIEFEIRADGGPARHYRVARGAIASRSGRARTPAFALIFADADAGFRTLSARDTKGAFLQALHDKELSIVGDFTGVLWFQRLTEFLPRR